MGAGRGFVFAATGDLYVHLVRRTARHRRAVAPGAEIDLYTDRDLADPVFSQVHRLDGSGTRPKMEALRRARFDRTVYLDADVVAVADPSGLFDLLDRADLVGVHELYGNSPNRANLRRPDIPESFREINTGVIGLARGPRTEAFMTEWEAAFRRAGGGIDQPVLRELLWDRPDLRVAIAPMDYNLMHVRLVRSYGRLMCAPRLLHLTGLHEAGILQTDPETPIALSEAMAEETRAALVALLEADRTLGAVPGFAERVAVALSRTPTVQRRARKLYKWWRGR